MDHILKSRPRDPPKTELDMIETMFRGDLLESWKLLRQTKSGKEGEKTFKCKGTYEKYKMKMNLGEMDKALKHFLGNVHDCFIKKYIASKRKTYMKVGLLNPKALSVEDM